MRTLENPEHDIRARVRNRRFLGTKNTDSFNECQSYDHLKGNQFGQGGVTGDLWLQDHVEFQDRNECETQ